MYECRGPYDHMTAGDLGDARLKVPRDTKGMFFELTGAEGERELDIAVNIGGIWFSEVPFGQFKEAVGDGGGSLDRLVYFPEFFTEAV